MKKLKIVFSIVLVIFANNARAMHLREYNAQLYEEQYEQYMKMAAKPVSLSLVETIRRNGAPILPAGQEITIGDIVGKEAYQAIDIGGELVWDTERAQQDGFSFRERNEFIRGELVLVPRTDKTYRFGIILEYFPEELVRTPRGWKITSLWKIRLDDLKYGSDKSVEPADIGKWIGDEPPSYEIPTATPIGAVAPVMQPIPIEPPPAYQPEAEDIPGPPENDDVPPAPEGEPEDDIPPAPEDDVPPPPEGDEDDMPPPPAPEDEDIPGPPDEDDVPPPPADEE